MLMLVPLPLVMRMMMMGMLLMLPLMVVVVVAVVNVLLALPNGIRRIGSFDQIEQLLIPPVVLPNVRRQLLVPVLLQLRL